MGDYCIIRFCVDIPSRENVHELRDSRGSYTIVRAGRCTGSHFYNYRQGGFAIEYYYIIISRVRRGGRTKTKEFEGANCHFQQERKQHYTTSSLSCSHHSLGWTLIVFQSLHEYLQNTVVVERIGILVSPINPSTHLCYS